MSQTDKVLIELLKGDWCDHYELEKVSGSRRVPARIQDLKDKGYVINTERSKTRDRHAIYQLDIEETPSWLLGEREKSFFKQTLFQ